VTSGRTAAAVAAGAAALIAGIAVAGIVVQDEPRSALGMSKLTPTGTVPYASDCRLPDGTRLSCQGDTPERQQAAREGCGRPLPLEGGGEAPGCDMDGQPRYQPEGAMIDGCDRNTRVDSGADEFYPPGCEPLLPGWPLDGPGATTTVTTTAPPPPTTTAPPVTTTTPPPPVQEQLLARYLEEAAASTLMSKWIAANPKESAAVIYYFQSGGNVPVAATAFGKSFVMVGQARRREVTEPRAPGRLLDGYQAQLAKSTLFVKWAAANKVENGDVDHYYRGVVGRPTTIRTPFGKAYLMVADDRRRETR
jgi:hypothetical protein